MKRAWMLWFAAVVAIIITTGCQMDGTDAWSHRQQRVTSDPVKDKPDESPAVKVDTSKEPPPGGVDALNSQVQSFVGRIPPKEGDRTAKPMHETAAQPAEESAKIAITQKPDAPTAASAPKPAPAAAPPTAVTANAPATAKPAAAAKPVANDAAASPKPVQLLPEKPTAAAPIEITEVRAAPNSTAATSQPAAAANQPIQPAAPPASVGVGPMIEELQQSIALHPQQWEDQFKLRLLYAATAQDEKATGPINGADPIQSELMAGAFRVLMGVRDAMRNPPSGGPTALLATDDLRRLISQQAPVIVPKIALVTRVNSFGDYDAVNPPRFTAGESVHVFLYAEVGNFRSESTGDGRLRTWLAEKVEIFDQTGKIVWQRSEPSIEDRVFSPRRDFFMTMEIQLPAETPPGEYVLKITVEDKLGATTDQQRMSFSIAK